VSELRVARVCIDSPLPHLDRLFDYSVPAKLAPVVAVGSRVRVAFAGRLVSAIVVELTGTSTYVGTLAGVKSAAVLPSFTATGLALAQAVAARYGGSLWDVCRLMAPPRVASVEKREWASVAPPTDRYLAASQTWPLEAMQSGLEAWDGEGSARVVWEVLPSAVDPCSVAATALLAPALRVAAQGRTAIVVVPDARAVAAVERELGERELTRWTARSGGDYTVLDHDDGPSQRYGSYLAGMLGHVSLVVGTRPAALQPVPALGLIAMWDDGASVYADPHAPYPHARTVAAMRADSEGAGLLLAGYAPSVDGMALVDHGWAAHVEPQRAQTRDRVATIDVLDGQRREAEGGTGWHWMPAMAWKALQRGIEAGPVGVVVPRAGYVSALACARCGQWAECRECAASLKQAGSAATPECTKCGADQENWHCPECRFAGLKQVRQGAERIIEQLRSMAPQWSIHASTAAAGILADYAVSEGLVVATPSALPAVRGGYSHIVVVGAAVPPMAELGAEVAAMRSWINVAALARARRNGGGVTVVGHVPDPVSHVLRAWLPGQYARDAYRERAELALPPARRVLQLHGDPDVVQRALDSPLPGAGAVTGLPGVTIAEAPRGRYILAPRGTMPQVVDHLRTLQQEWSRLGAGELRIVVDGPMGLAR